MRKILLQNMYFKFGFFSQFSMTINSFYENMFIQDTNEMSKNYFAVGTQMTTEINKT